MGFIQAQIHNQEGNIESYYDLPVKPEPTERIVQIERVTKGWQQVECKDLGKVVMVVVSTDGHLYEINDENTRKHSKYFEAKLHERIGVNPGELLKIKGHGACDYEDGWDIVPSE